MQAIWTEDIRIKVYETDFNGKLKISSIFNYFQEAAHNHATDLNVGFHKLKENDLFWVLSRIKVIIERLPDWGEGLKVLTWPKGIDKLFALRDFQFIDKNNIPVISGTSCWLLIDRTKPKLHKIEELGIYVPEKNKSKHAIAEVPDKIKIIEGIPDVFKHKVTVNDLDLLHHVNNSHYVDWIIDCFDPGNIKSKTIKSLQVNYTGESKFGDEVEIKIRTRENIQYIEGTKADENSIVFQAVMTWDK